VARPNVFSDELQSDPERAGFKGRYARVGAAAGAERLGACVYVLEPGETPSPYHLHRGNEELLVVLEGRPTLRTPEGERELVEGEVVAFPSGPAGAHQLTNRSDGRVRFVIASTERSPEILEYPDSRKVGVKSLPDEGETDKLRLRFPADAAVDYFEGEQAPS
jgi:uncharacterized cupin superfamily protein